MILFLEDYKKYPNCIIDTTTKNTSFIRIAAIYKEMGIINNCFMLVLLNPQLQGVDPFSPNLTIEQMGMVALEARANPWYAFRELLKAPGLAGKQASYFEANRGNISLFWCFFNHVMVIVTQMRQTGKSFSVDCLMTLLMNIMCQNTQINLLTKDDILRRKNIERLKEIANELPRYLQQKTRDDANNTEEITIKALGNSYVTHVPQASAKRAYNLGRGLTSPIFHIDEPPFQPNISISLPAALAAGGAAISAAKDAGAPYGTILTTTAGKKDDKEGKFVFKLIDNSANWTEKFFDTLNQADLEKSIKCNSREGVVRVSIMLSHKQLGKTDAWLKEKLDESLLTGEDASRDLLNQWTSGSETNPLDELILERISNSKKNILFTDISFPHGYITRWYIPEHEIHNRLMNGNFIMGADTSEASGGDDIAFVILDAESLEVIATAVVNETNLITFSEWVCSILVSYPKITAIIERRSTGAMLLDYLLLMLPQHGVDPFQRLFNRVVNDYDEDRDRYSEIKVPMGRRNNDLYVRYKKMFGFATAGSGYASRSELYSTTLQNAAKRSCDKIYDTSLIGQITGLVNKNGRIDHEDGEHDDMVISWLLCHWLLTLGKNLSHYGIDTSKVMSKIAVKNTETRAEYIFRMEQDRIRSRIAELFELMKAEPDDFISMRLEQELRVLDKQVVLDQNEVYSLDSLIANVKQAKIDKKRSYEYGKQSQQNYRNDYATSYMMGHSGSFSDTPLSSNEIYNRR